MSEIAGRPPIILWFRDDLRVSDHLALLAASSEPVVPLFILDTENPVARSPAAARRWWLEGSLAALDSDLAALGSRLILRRGDPLDILLEVIGQAGATRVFVTRAHEPRLVAEETAIGSALARRRVSLHGFDGALLSDPETIRTRSGQPFRRFSFFTRCFEASGAVGDCLPAPRRLLPPVCWPASERLTDWRLRELPSTQAVDLRSFWLPGAGGAAARLESFLRNRLAGNEQGVGGFETDATSGMSPHLSHGEISGRQVWDRANRAAAVPDLPAAVEQGLKAFRRNLLFREFSRYRLHHWPNFAVESFDPAYRHFPWRDDHDALDAWQRGMTGYPIVDAAMRELSYRGWIQHRLRFIAAAFLCQYLLIPWQYGAKWFLETLVDADLANNAAGWQLAVGCLTGRRGRAVICDPVRQGRRLDPAGSHIRCWVPELAALDDHSVHEPWANGVAAPGYPPPVIEPVLARQRALGAYGQLRR